jgi:hypothetical protein
MTNEEKISRTPFPTQKIYIDGEIPPDKSSHAEYHLPTQKCQTDE